MYKIERSKLDYKIIAISFLIVLLCFIAVIFQVYAEPDLNGVLKRNNFTGDKWLHNMNNLVINTTSNQLLLNKTDTLQEDLTSYTEIDTMGLLSIDNSSFITFDGDMRYHTNHIIYKNHETKGDFDYSFDLNIDSLSDTSRTIRLALLTLTNTTEDIIYHRDNNYECFTIRLFSRSNPSKYYLGLLQYENGANTNNNTESIQLYDVDTWYYLTLTRNNNDYTLYVYSDSSRSTLINDLRLTVTNKYSYSKLFAVVNYGYVTNENTKGYIRNLVLGSGFVMSGNYFSKNLLVNTTNNVYSYYTSSSLISNIDCFISGDNSTWIEVTDYNDHVVILDDYNYTRFYVWFRLNSTGSSTPYVRYYHLFHKESFGSGVTTNDNYWWIVFFFIVSPLLILLGVARKR